VFGSNVDKTILGKCNGVQYQAHAFASNVVGDTGPWGDDHLSNISGTTSKHVSVFLPLSKSCY
jgi:hypothetical protein